MTTEEKKMKRYCNAVERRLNLPRDIKVRVMTDFASSIQARREAGMTDTEIYAELGSPKKAAAELNAQMREYAYRKSPWRFLFMALAAWGGWQMMERIIALVSYYLFCKSQPSHSSVGFFGGADGPTAIFLTYSVPSWYHFVVPVLLAAVGIWGFLRLRKCTKK